MELIFQTYFLYLSNFCYEFIFCTYRTYFLDLSNFLQIFYLHSSSFTYILCTYRTFFYFINVFDYTLICVRFLSETVHARNLFISFYLMFHLSFICRHSYQRSFRTFTKSTQNHTLHAIQRIILVMIWSSISSNDLRLQLNNSIIADLYVSPSHSGHPSSYTCPVTP